MEISYQEVTLRDLSNSIERPGRFQLEDDIVVFCCAMPKHSMGVINLLPPRGKMLFNMNGTPNILEWSEKWSEGDLKNKKKDLIAEIKKGGAKATRILSRVSPSPWGFHVLCSIRVMEKVIDIFQALHDRFGDSSAVPFDNLEGDVKGAPNFVKEVCSQLGKEESIRSLLESARANRIDFRRKFKTTDGIKFVHDISFRVAMNMLSPNQPVTGVTILSIELASLLKWLPLFTKTSFDVRANFYGLIRTDEKGDIDRYQELAINFLKEMEADLPCLSISFLD